MHLHYGLYYMSLSQLLLYVYMFVLTSYIYGSYYFTCLCQLLLYMSRFQLLLYMSMFVVTLHIQLVVTLHNQSQLFYKSMLVDCFTCLSQLLFYMSLSQLLLYMSMLVLTLAYISQLLVYISQSQLFRMSRLVDYFTEAKTISFYISMSQRSHKCICARRQVSYGNYPINLSPDDARSVAKTLPG